MINNSNSSESSPNKTQGNSPLNLKDPSSPIGKTKLKQYGKKSLAPLVDLLHRYKDQINPYMEALDKGLQGACSSFNSSADNSVNSSINSSISTPNASRIMNAKPQSNEAEKVVSGWFREASDWFQGARDKMSTEDPKDLLNYLEEQAKRSPGLMFATSYVAGLVFGRLGRHIGRIKARESMQTSLQH